jgi:sister-chromatid-cohesion protein PDS5
MKDMETILRRDVDNKSCAEAMSSILKKLGTPIMTNIYYNTIKILLSRIASVMIDRENIEVLIQLIEGQLSLATKAATDNKMDEENDDPEEEQSKMNNVLLDNLKLLPEDTSAKGLNLLTVLIYLFPAHFLHESVLRSMMGLLNFDLEYASASVFKALTHLGRFKPLIESYAVVIEDLAPICKHYATQGTPKQSKHAIRCLFVNSNSSLIDKDDEETNLKKVKKQIDVIFQEIVDLTNANLQASSSHYRTAIVAFGHIAYNLPERFNIPLKNIVSRKIVKDLLIGDLPPIREISMTEGDWCDEEDLAEEIRCRVEGLKAIARWLVGLKDNVVAAQKTFRMLCAFISKMGDILDKGQLCEAEKAWLRVSAGNAMLKICEQKGVGDEYNAEQFLTLSTLMVR